MGTDGYRVCDQAIVIAFQAQVERGGMVELDYDALRIALGRCRDGKRPVALDTLEAAYNDVLYASYGYR
jgi:hypothetical protein